MGSREALPYKGRTEVSWPRRGCRGLYVHGGAFPTAAPDRLRHRGYGIWIAVPAYQRRPSSTGSIRKGLQSCAAQPSRVGAYKPVAEGGIVALELSASGSNRGQPGAPGDRRQLHREKSSSSAVPPFVRPIASEYPPTLGSHGVPQWARGDDTDKCSGGSCKARSRRSRATTHPRGDCEGQARGFPLRFPTPSIGFILHIPSQS